MKKLILFSIMTAMLAACQIGRGNDIFPDNLEQQIKDRIIYLFCGPPAECDAFKIVQHKEMPLSDIDILNNIDQKYCLDISYGLKTGGGQYKHREHQMLIFVKDGLFLEDLLEWTTSYEWCISEHSIEK